MPYTPPAQASPSTSRHTSPPTSSHGSHTNLAQSPSPLRCPTARPQLPRSNSSQSFMSRARRGPSFEATSTKSSLEVAEANRDANAAQLSPELPTSTSIRQSPPPSSNPTRMPRGALISPPDSTQHSSDDETSSSDANKYQELQQAVRRSLGGANNQASRNVSHTDNEPENNATAPPARLSESARKISHSRSATDTEIILKLPESNNQSATGSASDSEEDFMSKPPLLRKKSGELVKPAIRPNARRKFSSMPGTPTYGKKGVHFNDDIAQVRHFLPVDRPSAVSAGGSPVETSGEEGYPFNSQKSNGLDLKLCNFPRETLERQAQPVRLERLALSSDQKNLVGAVAVANLAFHKLVVARFTFDSWRTTSEVVAEFNNDTRAQPRSDGYDQFNFSIKVSDQASVEKKTLLLCIRYNVNGQDYWDNNDSANYQAEFIPKQRLTLPKADSSHLTTRPIPRSRHNSPASRPRSIDSLEDDFSSAFDTAQPFEFKRTPTGRKGLESTPPRRAAPVNQAFGGRYDFGASLTAALNQAQAQLGERSGLKVGQPNGSSLPERQPPARSARGSEAVPNNSDSASPGPSDIMTAKQPLDSRAYQEFVSKFCFAGTKRSGVTSAPAQQTQSQQHQPHQKYQSLDGASDMNEITESAMRNEGEEKQQQQQQQQDFGNFVGLLSPPRLTSEQNSGRSSPAPVTGHTAGTDSPPVVSFGYPYNQNSHGRLFDSHTATAIQS